MKLSFQTFCLVFGVTILHLIAITLFAPFTESASAYFSDLDVEAILENGREDLEAARTEPAGNGVERHETPEENSLDEPAVAALLRQDERRGNPDAPAGEAMMETSRPGEGAASEPAPGAIADVRVLAKRVARPGIDDSGSKPETREWFGASKLPDEIDRVNPVSGEKLPERPAVPLVIREVRPL